MCGTTSLAADLRAELDGGKRGARSPGSEQSVERRGQGGEGGSLSRLGVRQRAVVGDAVHARECGLVVDENDERLQPIVLQFARDLQRRDGSEVLIVAAVDDPIDDPTVLLTADVAVRR
jgi:hypothetical protein